MEIQNMKEASTACAVQEKTIVDKVFSRFFLTSLITLLIAIAALFSTTYAWYAASITTENNTITAAFYDVTVTVQNAGTELNAEADGSYRLTAGVSYAVTLKKADHATAENGYGKLICNGISYVTDQINGGEIDFTLESSSDTTVLFVPYIGTSAATEKISSGETLTLNP